MRCTTCRTELPPGAGFCPNCGTRAPEFTSSGMPTTVMSPPATGDRPPLGMPPPEGQLQAPYPPAGYYAPPQPPTSTAAIVSLVAGILGWTILPLVAAIVAVVAGHMARNEVRRSGGQVGGDGLAIAGMVMGYTQLILAALAICLIVAIGVLTLLGTRAS